MAQRDPIGKAPEASHQSFPTHPAAITMGQEGLIGGHGRVRQLESFFVGTWKKQSRSDCSLSCSESCGEMQRAQSRLLTVAL
jgi:hypothetical protein